MDNIVYEPSYTYPNGLSFDEYMGEWFKYQDAPTLVLTNVNYQRYFPSFPNCMESTVSGIELSRIHNLKDKYAKYIGTYHLSNYLLVDYYEFNSYLAAFIYTFENVLNGAIIYFKEEVKNGNKIC